MTDEKSDDKKFNETLKRMLETPPKPNEKPQPKDPKRKPGGRPVKKGHPEEGS